MNAVGTKLNSGVYSAINQLPSDLKLENIPISKIKPKSGKVDCELRADQIIFGKGDLLSKFLVPHTRLLPKKFLNVIPPHTKPL